MFTQLEKFRMSGDLNPSISVFTGKCLRLIVSFTLLLSLTWKSRIFKRYVSVGQNFLFESNLYLANFLCL